MITARSRSNKKGFTLIELLVVIAIIIALGITVFAAINPNQRLKDARDAQRTAAVDQILTAIHTYIIDQKAYPGGSPSGLSAGMSETQLGTGLAAACSPLATGGCSVPASTACIDLSGATSLGKYLKSIPVDPNGGSAASTKYSVVVDANGLVTVKACGTEGATNISASR